MSKTETANVTEVLLVVDMQAGFHAAQDRDLVEMIEREAQRVESRGGRVLEVRMDDSGEATTCLGRDVVWKKSADGGAEVYAYLVGAGLVSRDLRVRVSGVNLDACVFATADGLAKRLHDEQAISSAVSIVLGLCGNGSIYRIGFEVADAPGR